METTESEQRQKLAQQHFESIRSRLPQPLVDLYEDYGLHDGALSHFSTFQPGQVQLGVQAWNNWNGDHRVDYVLIFSGVSSFELKDAQGGSPGSAPWGFGDLGYFEVDILDSGLYRMDFLFWSGIELGISFSDIEVNSSIPD